MAENSAISWTDHTHPGPAPMPPREGDKVQARQRINVEVRSGRRPHPNSLPCVDCQHIWIKGERRHEYDHHLGYAAEHHYVVEAVCTTCHAKRESGHRFRPMAEQWAIDIMDQCAAAGTSFHFKQYAGVKPKELGRLLAGREHNGMPPPMGAGRLPPL